MDRSERHTNYPNLLRFVSLIHYLLLVFHWNACLFHLLHYTTGFGFESNGPNSDNIVKNSEKQPQLWDTSNQLWDSSNYPVKGDSMMTYLKSVYWTVLAMTTIGGLPSPKTRSDFLYVIFELVIGLITFATVLGYIANIVTNVSAARKDFQGKGYLTSGYYYTYRSENCQFERMIPLKQLITKNILVHIRNCTDQQDHRAQPDWAYEFPDRTGPDTQICRTGPVGPD